MAFIFSDSFDWYTSAQNDLGGYWDSGGTSSAVLSTGRFSSSQAWRFNAAASIFKNSATNDATHHIVVAFEQTTSASGSTSCNYFSLGDGATAQCSIVFRSDGTILLTSGSFNGSTLATYSNAFSANLWTAFEFEVTIDNANGAFRARKNGNTSNDFAATGLNTRGGTSNSYANRLIFACNSTAFAQWFDDLLWFSTSGAAPNTWVGDVRAAQMMPASDASVQFSKSPNPYTQSSSSTTTQSQSANNVRLMPFVAGQTGTIGTIVLFANTGATANVKAAIYDNTGVSGAPGAVLGTSNALVNPVTGANTVTFGSPPSVTRGTTYYLAVDQDATVVWTAYSQNPTWTQTTTYASFPANPASASNGGALNSPSYTINITPTSYTLVNEAQEDGTTSYVYDNTVGHADFYAVTTIPTTSTVTAVTTRGFMAKSDAGLRSAQVQLKSSSTTVQSTAINLSTSFQWVYRTDTVDPNTNSTWSATNLNSIQVGPLVTS